MGKHKYDYRFDDGSNIFFTSDTHYNHENIIKMCNRPFSSVEEMNETMIENWNKVVSDDSIVFHLGDVAWGNNWKPFLERLNGRKVLIMGNHDFKNRPPQNQLDEYFEFVTQQMFIKIENRQVYLNHYPFLCYSGVYRDKESLVYALNGHIHLGPTSLTGKDIPRMELSYPTQYDVGVDMNNFTPVNWKVVDSLIKYQIDNNTNMMHWVKNNEIT